MMYALLSSDKKSQICLTTITLRLAKEGLVLEQSYVQPICTPTRWARNIHFLKTWNIYVNLDIFSLFFNLRNVLLFWRPTWWGLRWWADCTRSTRDASTAFFGRRSLADWEPRSLFCQGNSTQSIFAVKTLPGCSRRKDMQLTWWASGTWASAAKRCCPQAGWTKQTTTKVKGGPPSKKIWNSKGFATELFQGIWYFLRLLHWQWALLQSHKVELLSI